ncbi:hypothetical protein EsH8_X_000763 [Colletotrichum jinshuiense]
MNSLVPVQDLRGKVALVTGATRGIGRAIALHLAGRGASILGTCSSAASLNHIESLKQEVHQVYGSTALEPPRIFGLAANVLSSSYAQLIVDEIRTRFEGKLNIMVNNAAYTEFRPMGELDTDYVNRILVGNLQSLVLLMELLYKTGSIQPESRIVNVSSDASRTSIIPFPGIMLYASTKAAVESLTRSWADILSLDKATFGTTVNSLSVGGTATETFLETTPPAIHDAALKVLSKGKSIHSGLGLPDDVAHVAGLLVSETARWINGSVVAANGGAIKIM